MGMYSSVGGQTSLGYPAIPIGSNIGGCGGCGFGGISAPAASTCTNSTAFTTPDFLGGISGLGAFPLSPYLGVPFLGVTPIGLGVPYF